MRLLLTGLALLLLPLAAAQVGQGSLSMAWSPREPEPSYVLDVPLKVTYTAQPPASLEPARVALAVRSGDASLNVTIAPADLDLAPPPAGGSASANATVHLRWLFAPPRSATTGLVDITATTDATATGAAQSAKEQMVVRYPGGLGGNSTASPGPAPAAPAATPLAPWLILAALVLAARRRVHGRA